MPNEKTVEERLGVLEYQIESIDKKMDGQSKKLDVIIQTQTDLKILNERVSGNSHRLDTLEKDTKEDYESFQNAINLLREEIKGINTRVIIISVVLAIALGGYNVIKGLLL